MIYKDLTGQSFGRLTVLYRTKDHYYPSGRHDVQYRCICDCGNELDVLGIHLRSGHTKSCGCFRKEVISDIKRIHGMTNTRLYNEWKSMKSRCRSTRRVDYASYAGRGIVVCDEWLNNFETFRDWAIANGYADNLTLDRCNVNGNYEPNNCRWVTQKEQCNNTRRNIRIEINGETHTMKEWSDIVGGVNYKTIQSRIKRGWPPIEAIKTKSRRTRIEHN